MIETELFPLRDGRVARDGITDYKIIVQTSDVRNAGTEGVVTMRLFGQGKDGKELASRDLKLESSTQNFTRNRTDAFFVKLPDLGAINKCRVTLSVRGAKAGCREPWECALHAPRQHLFAASEGVSQR